MAKTKQTENRIRLRPDLIAKLDSIATEISKKEGFTPDYSQVMDQIFSKLEGRK